METKSNTLDILGAPVTKNEIIKWVRALRSGRYEQTKNYLQTAEGYCCLGVACKIFIPEEKLERRGEKFNNRFVNTLAGTMPSDQTFAPEWLAQFDRYCTEKQHRSVVGMNDKGESFLVIADHIERVTGFKDEGHTDESN